LVVRKRFTSRAECPADAQSIIYDKARSVESADAIRKKATVRPAIAGDIGVKHENFFVAKFADSESVQRASRSSRRVATPTSRV